jgi:MoxR-like ATPase
MKSYSENIEAIVKEVGKVIIGKDHIINKVLTAILAKGHILIEDIPGVGKTTLALAFSRAMDLEHNRLQFTPDVLPTDIVGYHLLNRDGIDNQYKPGPVMCNLFLADEINRTSPKTQSSLLEVMEEGNVTVDGITREIPKPFTVIATQNPIGSIGTQTLPESQLDRFMIRLTMGYPDINSEVNMLKGRQGNNPLSTIEKAVNKQDILDMQEMVQKVYIHDSIYDFIVNIVLQTRKHPYLELGLSPRGTIAFTNMAKANAFIHNRDYMIPDDVKEVFQEVASHRMLLKSKARIHEVTMEQVIEGIMHQVQAPKIG